MAKNKMFGLVECGQFIAYRIKAIAYPPYKKCNRQ